MAVDLATTNDGGVSNMAIGSFIGDGTDMQVTCGFLPRYLKLVNLTDLTEYEIFMDMAAGVALKTISTGVRTNDASGILRKGSADGYRGFFVPLAININAKAFHYVAFG